MDSSTSPRTRRAEPATREAQAPGRKRFLKTPLGWACVGFAALAVIFLFTEHTAHVFRVLPWLAVLACPLLHVFLHRGHGQGRHDHGGAADKQ
jgi:hypothetical protein